VIVLNMNAAYLNEQKYGANSLGVLIDPAIFYIIYFAKFFLIFRKYPSHSNLFYFPKTLALATATLILLMA